MEFWFQWCGGVRVRPCACVRSRAGAQPYLGLSGKREGLSLHPASPPVPPAPPALPAGSAPETGRQI